ncbi:unnamed protein product [Cylicocyclus nassatus]|uniref:Uncharacterized protein n=1 Tax=Cylicocyclus nassatus TaxID=53992 RepID=A0AA36DKM7_CYLNA|nr:unnamed protein product [Cylicocyclus nassatus]
MLIILAATLVLLSSFTETLSAPTYKCATEVFRGLTEFNDAEFEEFKKGVLELGKTKPEPLKANKALIDKWRTMDMRSMKLMKPAYNFVIRLLSYAAMEMRKEGSQAQNIQKDFETLRKDKKACENLLSSYPKLKLGEC